MSAHPADIIARTLLYEGYRLYPSRPSAVKNQHRFNFGVLYPRHYCTADGDAWHLQAECPVQGDSNTSLDVRVRCLQMIDRPVVTAENDSAGPEQQAVEREVSITGMTLGSLERAPSHRSFGFAPPGAADDQADQLIRGEVLVRAEEVRPGTYKVTVQVSNVSPLESGPTSRNDALLRSLVSSHMVLTTSGGDLISLLDPPQELRDITATCLNVGVWPVLVGDEGRHDCVLASPIILDDYPEVAPESMGDRFDATEIDEILTSDDEKREAGGADERARLILDRTGAVSQDDWIRLYGAVGGLRKLTEES